MHPLLFKANDMLKCIRSYLKLWLKDQCFLCDVAYMSSVYGVKRKNQVVMFDNPSIKACVCCD